MGDPNWTSFQNVSSSLTAAPFAPLQVVDVLLMENDDLVLQCDQVGSSDNPEFNRRIVFNGPCSIAPQGYGRCTESLRVTAAWDSGTPNPGDSWGIAAGQFSLTLGGVGDFVVDGIVDSGTNRMYGRWGGIKTLVGKCGSSAIAADSAGTMNIWSGTAGSEAAATGWSVPVFCRGFGVAAGGWMSAQIIDGQWYGTANGATMIAQLTTAISGRSGSTPGTGSGYLMAFDGTSLTATASSITILTNNETGFGQNTSDGNPKCVQVVFMYGYWWMSTDDCS